jgi:cell division protein FtsB
MAALVAAALLFAVMGGEYSTPQWLGMRSRERDMSIAVAALAREVDSLQRVKKAVENDPVTQERIARELYGMLRPGEIEFTLVKPSDK